MRDPKILLAVCDRQSRSFDSLGGMEEGGGSALEYFHDSTAPQEKYIIILIVFFQMNAFQI